MAIMIDLKKREYVSQQREVESRTDICITALQCYMNEYFVPTDLEIWKRAPLVELEGEKIKEISLEGIANTYEIRNKFNEILNNGLPSLGETVFRINGKWTLDGIDQKGFFSINNSPVWKSAYGDIDIDLYTNRDQDDDLMELFWRDRTLRFRLVDKFFENFLKNYDTKNYTKRMALKWISFASGIPTRTNVSAIKAAYYHRERGFVSDSFRTFQEKNEPLRNYLFIEWILKTVYRQPVFRDAVESMLKKFRINKRKGNSVTLVGHEIDSFKNLYENFAEVYIQPIFDEFPTDETLNNKIKKVISEQHKILSE